MNFYLSRSSDQPGMKRTSSFHAYYALHGDEDRTEDLDFVAQSAPVMAGLTVHVDEPQTTRVQLNEDINEDKTKTAETDDGKKAETDMEAEFAG